MLGLGEREDEVKETIQDLFSAGCTIVTLGQYLQPSSDHMEVAEYITPGKFEEYRLFALNAGFAPLRAAHLYVPLFMRKNM